MRTDFRDRAAVRTRVRACEGACMRVRLRLHVRAREGACVGSCGCGRACGTYLCAHV